MPVRAVEYFSHVHSLATSAKDVVVDATHSEDLTLRMAILAVQWECMEVGRVAGRAHGALMHTERGEDVAGHNKRG